MTTESAPAYDRIGVSYSDVRRADPRFEAAIREALGDAQTVLNIGAGAGSYEPWDRNVIAVEPSPAMIAQRRADAAPAIQGVAEAIPLADKSVDATMGVFTMQHWDDVDHGLMEVLRVTRKRIAFLTLDLDVTAQMWLCRDYLPEIIEHDRRAFPTIAHLQTVLRHVEVETILCPPTARMDSWSHSGAGPRLTSNQTSAAPPPPGTNCNQQSSRTAWTDYATTLTAASGIAATDTYARLTRST